MNDEVANDESSLFLSKQYSKVKYLFFFGLFFIRLCVNKYRPKT